MKLHPFYECIKTAQEQVLLGNEVYQKFKCEKCDTVQYIEHPNHFYEKGECEECGHITDIVKDGCNYMLVINGSKY